MKYLLRREVTLMTRSILATLAAFTVLTFGGVTGVMAQQKPGDVKSMQNPCAAKSQPAEAKSEKDSAEAIREAIKQGKTAEAYARDTRELSRP
jgi:hypothetical protein